MAQSVSLWGATYNQVPALDVPKAGGGTARFTDASITTAVESDVASGKVFIKADGSQGTGTASGGGGHVTQDQDGYVVLPKTGGGGGGSSDFSTAEVTFICNASNQVDVNIAVIEEASLPFVPSARSRGGYQLYKDDEFVVNAVLYKGRCSCAFIGATSASGTGAIERINESDAIITGDCTITIS